MNDSATSTSEADAPSYPDRLVGVENLLDGLYRTVERYGDRTAVRTLDGDVDLTWRQLTCRAEDLARGLDGVGVCAGDPVALMLGTRPEFQIVDLAVVMLGAAPFSVYQTFPPEQIEHVLRNSGARIVIAERSYLSTLTSVVERLEYAVRIVLVDGDGGSGTVAELEEAGRGRDVDLAVRRASLDADSLITLIYTSGTTGVSKGVEVTHGNVLACARDFPSRVALDGGSRIIGWLPAAHIAERIVSYYMPVLFGCEVVCCPDVKQIGAYLSSVRPTYFMGVPRIWEKLQAAIETMWTADPHRTEIRRALTLGARRTRHERAGIAVPADLTSELASLDARFFAPVRRRLGLDELVTAHIGSAPAPAELVEFFHAIGVLLAEVWGMSETTGAGTSNPVGAIRIGTVGLPTDGVELRIADDGEVLVRSGTVTRGYRGMPAETAEAIVDGWLRTGDLGSVDDDGYLRLIGRKKEIIINAAGKNMAPARIEAELKSSTPLIGQACCVGDGRPYNVAVLALDPDYAAAWAADHGIRDTTTAALSRDPEVLRELASCVASANAKLSRPEQIKKFVVSSDDWQPGEELTPTMKLKRSAVIAKYQDGIAALYAE